MGQVLKIITWLIHFFCCECRDSIGGGKNKIISLKNKPV